jgi:hypothetical protein
MIVSPPALLFIVLAAFVLGIVSGVTGAIRLFILSWSHMGCDQLYRIVSRMLFEHWKEHPDCDCSNWILRGERHD